MIIANPTWRSLLIRSISGAHTIGNNAKDGDKNDVTLQSSELNCGIMELSFPVLSECVAKSEKQTNVTESHEACYDEVKEETITTELTSAITKGTVELLGTKDVSFKESNTKEILRQKNFASSSSAKNGDRSISATSRIS